jgi:glycosyltransferase involved in cell wall biosynthesis
MINFIYYPNAKLLLTVHDVSHELQSISRFDSIISISEAVSNDIFKRHDITSKIIANGVAMHLFRKKDNYTISDNKKFKIVQISRLIHEKKGQDILINSMVDVERYNLNFQLQIDFIGDGPSELYLKELVKKKKIKSEINFRGNKNKKWITQNLSDYDLLIQPSIYEGFGLTILEGFSANIPVIASDIDGPAEILKDLNFEFLFSVNNPERCASKIISIIKLYEQNLIKELVEDSYEKLFKKYDVRNTINGYENCYSTLLNKK